MPSLRIFCDKKELQEWIIDLAHEKKLMIVTIGEGGELNIYRESNFRLKKNDFSVFLFSDGGDNLEALNAEIIKPRAWGWIDIRAGGIFGNYDSRVLLYSEIHGEKCDSVNNHPDKWVQWLRKKITNQVYSGVLGVNSKTGGNTDYRDIFYTSEALSLYDEGVVWKQFLKGNAVFHPLSPYQQN